MSEFVSDFFNNHLKSISYDDSLVSSQSADEKKSMPSILGKYKATATITIEQFDRILEIFPKIKPIYRKIDIGSQIKFEQWHSYRRTILAILSECEFVTRSEIFSRGFRYKFIDEIINPNNQEIRIPMIILCGYKYKRKMEMTLSKLVKRGIIRRHKIGPYTYYNLKKKQEK